MITNLSAEVALVRKSRLFDSKWYLDRYPDVGELGMDPLEHFLRYGVRMNRDPSPVFNCESYFEANPDLDPAFINPLVHYALAGRREERPLKPVDAGQSKRSYRELKRDRGTILLVGHDSEVGGAQQVLLTFAEWLVASTTFDVKLVTLQGGPWAQRFQDVAATLNLSDLSEHAAPKDISRALHNWAGDDVKAVFLNSIASGGFLTHWREDAPVIAYVHELPKVLAMFEQELELVKSRAAVVIGGSEAVRRMLNEQHGVDDARLRLAYSFIGDQSDKPPVDTLARRSAKLALGYDEDDFIVAGSGILNWRKAPELFIQVAGRVVAEYGPKAKFMWIGSGNDLPVCEQLAAVLGLQDNVRFTGIVPRVPDYLKACDVFLLPSLEDPFPLACLHAAEAGIPVICFEDAGGMPEFTARGAGRAVPFKSVAAMSEATLDYARDFATRRRDGGVGKALVDEDFTITTRGPQVLHQIREAAGLSPCVSVLLPVAGAASLDDSLRALTMQTFQDFEVLLLGDLADDATRALVEAFARKRPGTRVIRGSRADEGRADATAHGDLVWIGEADHFASPGLLKALVGAFENPEVTCASAVTIDVDRGWVVPRSFPGRYLDRMNNWPARPAAGAPNGSVMIRRFRPDSGTVDPVAEFLKSRDRAAVMALAAAGTAILCADAIEFRRTDATIG